LSLIGLPSTLYMSSGVCKARGTRKSTNWEANINMDLLKT